VARIKARRYQQFNKTTGEVNHLEEYEDLDIERLSLRPPYVFYSQISNDWFLNVSRPAWGIALLFLHIMEGGGRIQLTQQEIADIFNMSRGTVNTALKQLRTVGFIKRLRFGYLVDETKVLKKLRNQPHRLAADNIHHIDVPVQQKNAEA
jgi:biotin operon repressor